MIPRRFFFAIIVALVISGVCTLWLSRRFLRPNADVSTGLHYVATKDAMEAGDILHADKLKLVDWPEKSPLTGTFAKPEEVEGRTLLYPLAAGQPLLQQQLAAAGSGPGLSPKIPEGMRAISLKSDQVVGVAGYLLPGTHVDVLVTYKIDPSPEQITSTVVQDAQILAAGQKMQPDPEGKPTTVDVVTLLVTPEDADKAVLAAAQGTVHFVLRNGSDHQHVDDKPTYLSQFGGATRPRAVPTAGTPHKATNEAYVNKQYVVTTIRGDKSSTEAF